VTDANLFRKGWHERHFVRSVLPDPVPEAVIRSGLEDAQLVPSSCSAQPAWRSMAPYRIKKGDCPESRIHHSVSSSRAHNGTNHL
jgi:hypothetical protein